MLFYMCLIIFPLRTPFTFSVMLHSQCHDIDKLRESNKLTFFVDSLSFPDDLSFADISSFADGLSFADDLSFADGLSFADDLFFADDLSFIDDLFFADGLSFADDLSFANNLSFADGLSFCRSGRQSADTSFWKYHRLLEIGNISSCCQSFHQHETKNWKIIVGIDVSQISEHRSTFILFSNINMF